MAKKITEFAHPDYVRTLPDWIKIRDCFNGERAIKSASTAYLPRLKGQDQADYDNYLYRALFFPITGKTVGSLVGLATSKKPRLEHPETMDKYFSDTESALYQFTEFYVGTFNEVVLQGRIGVLIDAPEIGGDPYPVPYIAENVINWRPDAAGNLVMLLLREHVTLPGKGEFDSTQTYRYRHCFVRAGVYMQEELDEDLEVVKGPFIPTFSGNSIDYIPFTCIGSSGCHMWVDKPPMLDISTINISHYLTSADLEWGRHLVGLPTPVVSGVDAGTKLSIGGTTAWILPVPDAKAYYMEFMGQGLASLEKAMTEKIGLMSSLSARLVDSSAKGSEAAEAVRLRYVNEAASLIHIIGSIETGLTIVFNQLAKLLRSQGEVKVALQRDVLGNAITFNDMKVMFEAYLNGSISAETLIYNLRRLDALDPNREDSAELAVVKASAAARAAAEAKEASTSTTPT